MKESQPMYRGNPLIWILSVDFFSHSKDTMATPLLSLLLLQKLECRARPSMLGMIKSPPRFLACPLVLKCLLKRTYVEELRAEDKVPRRLPRCRLPLSFKSSWVQWEVSTFGHPLRRLPKPCSAAGFAAGLSSFYFPPSFHLYRGKWPVNYAWSIGCLSILTTD